MPGVTGRCREQEGERNCANVYVLDFLSGNLIAVSRPPGVGMADGSSSEPSISADVNLIAFASRADNLVEGDSVECSEEELTGNCSDVFLANILLGTTVAASRNGAGEPGDWNSDSPALSSDGAWLAFVSYASNLVEGDTDACGNGEQSWNCADVFLLQVGSRNISRISTGG